MPNHVDASDFRASALALHQAAQGRLDAKCPQAGSKGGKALVHMARQVHALNTAAWDLLVIKVGLPVLGSLSPPVVGQSNKCNSLHTSAQYGVCQHWPQPQHACSTLVEPTNGARCSNGTAECQHGVANDYRLPTVESTACHKVLRLAASILCHPPDQHSHTVAPVDNGGVGPVQARLAAAIWLPDGGVHGPTRRHNPLSAGVPGRGNALGHCLRGVGSCTARIPLKVEQVFVEP